jgi:chromosome segregation ATPase
VEELLKKLLEGQEQTSNQLMALQESQGHTTNQLKDLQESQDQTTNQLKDLQESLGHTNKRLNDLQNDVTDIKEVVQRIENHQEETVMGMLLHIKKQSETKESQIQVLNKRLFEVETKTEQTQQ